MGWQKTFTLGRRAKGCHLVTDEILSNIESGLRDVKVSRSACEDAGMVDESLMAQVGMLFLFM